MSPPRVPGTAGARGLYLAHVGLLTAGALAGLALARAVQGLDLDFSSGLSRARELGIVSWATLHGRAPSRDLLICVSTVAGPVLLAWLPWLVWSRGRRVELRELFAPPAAPGTPPRPAGLAWIALAAAGVLLLGFDVNRFVGPAFNRAVGAWLFLSEEGAMLEWAGRTLRGEVYGRDYVCGYGPMLIYPLAGALRVFGESVLVARVYSYALNLVGYAVALLFLQRTLRSGPAFLLASLAYGLAFNMLAYFSVNTTLLRVVLGLAPLLLVHEAQRSGRRALLALGGAVAGQSLLLSQEVGVCSLAASALLLALGGRPLGGPGCVPRGARHFGAGAALSVAPLLGILAWQGALGPVLASLWEFPRLVTLGFGALPFPPLAQFAARPLSGGATLHYWVLLVYVFSLIQGLPRLLLGRGDSRLRLELALACFGLLLFRIAVSRSDEFNVFKASHPAFLLCFLQLDRAFSEARSSLPRARRMGSGCAGLALVASLALLSTSATQFGEGVRRAVAGALDPGAKLAVRPGGVRVPATPRARVRVDEATARSLEEIRRFLAERTRPVDPVYFFPNEAMYAFLFDRRNPTRYALAYTAITSRHRRELIADLEARKPRYVVFSRDTWRVDGIPLAVQMPEVLAYLRRAYRPVLHGDGVTFLERDGSRGVTGVTGAE